MLSDFSPKRASLPEEALNMKSTCTTKALVCSVNPSLRAVKNCESHHLSKAQRKDRAIEISWKGEKGSSQRSGIEIKNQKPLKVYCFLLYLYRFLFLDVCGN